MAQTVFSLDRSGNDGSVTAVEAVYPPLGSSPVANSTLPTDGPIKSFGGGFYEVRVFLLRWDTSIIPFGSTILGATLRLYINTSFSVNSRSLTAEWYEPGTIDVTDWTATVGTDAHSGTLLSDISDNQDQDFALENISNIDPNGYTGLRLHISGATPTGGNVLSIETYDHLTLPAPRLIVDYVFPDLDNLAPRMLGR